MLSFLEMFMGNSSRKQYDRDIAYLHVTAKQKWLEFVYSMGRPTPQAKMSGPILFIQIIFVK